MSENEDRRANVADAMESFPVQTNTIPGLILERCIAIDATLATILGIQIEILAHLTGKSVDEETVHWVDMLNKHNERIATEMRHSQSTQPQADTA